MVFPYLWCFVGMHIRYLSWFLRWVVGKLVTAILSSGWFRYSGGDLVGYRILVFLCVWCFGNRHTRYWSWFLRWVIDRLSTPFFVSGWLRYSGGNLIG